MPIAPLSTPFQHPGGRRFSFYPAIRNIEHNEWVYRRATWSECIVANTRSGEEIPVPRMAIGDVSGYDEPVMLVRLNKELEWRSGAILPCRREVIEFPAAFALAVNGSRPAPARGGQPAPVINIRLESRPEIGAGKWIGVALVLGVVALTIVAGIAKQTPLHRQPEAFRGYRAYLQLAATDDYFSTIHKLGLPASYRSYESGDRVYRSLAYPSRGFRAILMGPAGQPQHYIGALGEKGQLLDSVRLPDGSPAEFLLHSLPPF